MELKPGYKQTEVGVIPEEWDIHSLNSCLSKSPDYGLNAPAVPFSDKLPTYIRITDIDGEGRFSPEKPVSVNHIESDNYYLREGDIVFARTGASVGKSYMYNPLDGKFVFAGFLIRVSPDITKLIPAYLASYVKTGTYWNWVSFMSMRSGQPGINGKEYGQLPIPLPPTIDEQQAIATALSDMDALIESLDRLIAKKRDIKQAAMQDLLTGKRRLPEFSGAWKTKPLGEVIENCSSGATPYRGHPEYYKGEVKWITSGELNYNLITDTIEHISYEAVDNTNLKIHPVGTFLIAITGLEAVGTRGACGIVGSPATTNQSCMAIYPTSELKTEYLYHYYVFRGNDLAIRYCQGTKQQSYTAKIVKLLPIDLPPTVDEQKEIATVLSNMDTEISALEKKRDKTKLLKQGMMQELLTGRIRLI